ncbi:hypothetical protein [uncultured Pseudoalteromonas sp.]|uniref:hypothetical protein n=1 Tax=uncultured Pseudoalteromonas sp. TaxID=114053 RepID=UPI00260FB85A|nr:hypothetical protein [uncultured Pseudoalteromonas sp.]
MFTNKKSLLALSVASAFALTGCFSDDDNNKPVPDDGGDGGDGGVVVVAPETPAALTFVVSGSVVQSNDDDEFDVIGDATIKFLESGVLSTNIVDVEGNQVQTLDVGDEGSFLVTRKSGSSTDSVTAIVSAPGFVTKAFSLDLSNEDDNDVLVAQFLLTPTDEEGLAAKTTTSSDITGSTTTQPIEADASVDGSSLATATLPSGITLQDADGQPVTGAEVTLDVLGTDPSTETKSLVLPEGLNSDDSSANIAVPVSLANVTLSVDGTSVKKFAGDTLNVTLAAPADLDAGEVLSVSSLDEETGIWMPETFPVTKGTGTVSFETDHLTWFSVNKSVPVCTDGLTVNFTGDAVPAGGLTLAAYSADGFLWSRVGAGSTSRVVPPGFLKRYGISSEATATVVVFDRDGAIWGETDGEVAVCGTVNDFALAAPYTLVNKTLTITGSCANDSDVAVDVTNSAVRYKRDGKAVRTALKDADGNFQLTNLREGEDYEVTVNFRGLPLEGSNTISLDAVTGDDLTENFEFTCPEVTGSGGTGSTGGTGG